MFIDHRDILYSLKKAKEKMFDWRSNRMWAVTQAIPLYEWDFTVIPAYYFCIDSDLQNSGII